MIDKTIKKIQEKTPELIELEEVKDRITGILFWKNARFKYLKANVQEKFYKEWVILAEKSVKIGNRRLEMIEASRKLTRDEANYEEIE
ncbi:hypothetical protein A9Q91_03660 [Candidatus Gracilibacteria bacterium 28_42_T64]|nr:hypothetical protein A9Q91_03660 [Candidatus Gracilibacteria bacterium 28_42_T64]